MAKQQIICREINKVNICKCYRCRETLPEGQNKEAHECNPLCKWISEGETHLKCKLCGQVLPKEEVTGKEECPTIVGIRGLGDVIAVAAKKIGIKQHKDCGCGKKQNKLNKILPFKKENGETPK